MVDNGHIYAPISIGEVAGLLGERTSDIGKLCMSEKINPYSLIRPFSEEITSAQTLVKDLRTARVGKGLTSTEQVKWERKLWGYQVPYANSLGVFTSQVRNVSWYRATPTENDYKNLEHFDGYLHNAKPSLGWFANVETGQRISIAFQFGGKQEDIVSTSGVRNKGGVVSVLEVFGDDVFYFGVTVTRGGVSDYFFSDAINPSSMTFGTIDTNITAQTGTTYEITPWICNKKPEGSNTLPLNANYYSLKFTEDYEPYKTFTTGRESVSLRLSIENEVMVIEATNTFAMAYNVSNITMHIQYIRRADYDGSDITNPSTKEETRTINESIYVNGKNTAAITITGERAKVNLTDTYPTARVWLTANAYQQGDVSYWQETMSNMVIATR